MWLLICSVPIWQAGTASNRISCEPLWLFFLSAVAMCIDLRQRPARLRHSNLILFEVILKGWEFWLYQYFHPVSRLFKAMFGSSMIRKFEFYGPQELGVLRNVVFGGPHRSHVGWLCKHQVPASSLKAGDVGCLFWENLHSSFINIQSCTQNLALKSPFQILPMRKNVIGSVALLRLEQLLCAEPSVSWRAHVGAATCDWEQWLNWSGYILWSWVNVSSSSMAGLYIHYYHFFNKGLGPEWHQAGRKGNDWKKQRRPVLTDWILSLNSLIKLMA